jgi:hypothetical protein
MRQRGPGFEKTQVLNKKKMQALIVSDIENSYHDSSAAVRLMDLMWYD